jgi:resuscitation-promoting factor RpfB
MDHLQPQTRFPQENGFGFGLVYSRFMAWLQVLREPFLARARFLAAGLAVAGLTLIAAATSRPVSIVIDGQARAHRTHAPTVASALHDAGVDLRDGDMVRPDLTSRLIAGTVIEVRRARDVVLEVDGVVTRLRTAEPVPANILAQAGRTLFPGDRVWVDGFPSDGTRSAGNPPPARIRLERAVAITLIDRGARRGLASAAPTVGEALWENGVHLREGDELLPGAGASLGGPTGVTWTPARRLAVEVDGRSLVTYASPATVGEALARAGLGLVGLDRADPSLDQPVPADGRISVVRVVEEVELIEEPIPFTNSFEPVEDLEIDLQQLVDPGALGVQAERIRIRREDGDEVSRYSEGEWVALEPRPRVLGYGTKIVIRTLDTPEGPIEYWRAVPIYATSYSPCRLGVDYCNANLASGGTLQKGIAAVLLRWYRSMRGMYVYVPGYGTARIADTGGGIPGRHWIDLGYSDDDYVSWHNWTTVYFLTPVPPEGLIMWVLE